MSDRGTAYIKIGGHVADPDILRGLVAAINSEVSDLEEGKTVEDVLWKAAANGTVAEFCSHDIADGEMTATMAYCDKHRIPYVHHRAAMHGRMPSLTTLDDRNIWCNDLGNPVMSMAMLDQMGASWSRVLKALAPIRIPPLTIEITAKDAFVQLMRGA
jgi:hypothetical protein